MGESGHLRPDSPARSDIPAGVQPQLAPPDPSSEGRTLRGRIPSIRPADTRSAEPADAARLSDTIPPRVRPPLPPPPPVHQAGPGGAGEDPADRRSYRRPRRRRSMPRSSRICSTGCGRGTSSCASPGRSTRRRRPGGAVARACARRGAIWASGCTGRSRRRGGGGRRGGGAGERSSRRSPLEMVAPRLRAARGRRRRGAGPGRGRRLLSDRPARRRRVAAAVRGDRLEHRAGPRRDPRALPRAGARRRAAARGRRTWTRPRTCAAWPPAWPSGDLGCPRTRALLGSWPSQSQSKIQNPKWRRHRMRILTAEAMREVDRAAIEELGIPSLVLMENAAIGVVEAIGEAFGDAELGGDLLRPGQQRRRRPGGRPPPLGARLGGADLPGHRRPRAVRPTPPCSSRSAARSSCRSWRSPPRRTLRAALEAAAELRRGGRRPVRHRPRPAARRAVRRAWWRGSTSCRVPCVAVDLPSGLAASRAAADRPARARRT